MDYEIFSMIIMKPKIGQCSSKLYMQFSASLKCYGCLGPYPIQSTRQNFYVWLLWTKKKGSLGSLTDFLVALI
jgi:hypothetical protein